MLLGLMTLCSSAYILPRTLILSKYESVANRHCLLNKPLKHMRDVRECKSNGDGQRRIITPIGMTSVAQALGLVLEAEVV